MTDDARARVRDALASHYDAYGVRRQLHDVPPHAVYEVVVDGTRAVCKLARGPRADPGTEARVIQHVEANTSVPVPHVLAVGDGHFVAEWNDGLLQEAPQEAGLDEAKARAMGAGLATLHAETSFEATGFPTAAPDGLTVETHGTWPETVRAFLDDRRDYLDDFGYGDVAEAAHGFVREHPDAFADAGDPVLCHGNYLPDHVGVDGDEVVSVIDFEHALVAPAEYDYWRTALSLLANEEERTEATFREGYRSVRALPDGFDRRRRLYSLVNTVSYLKSLHLQRNVTGKEAKRRAEWMRDYVYESLDEASGELE